jgi:predicted porin
VTFEAYGNTTVGATVGSNSAQGDVLTGYAPDNFTLTVAEFGPPTGLTLDPADGLQTQFLPAAVRARAEPLAAQGVTTSLFDDESGKVLYVLPKYKGWLAGVSFSPDAGDPRFDRLTQAGLVHETYWHQNVWRWGGTYANVRTSTQGAETGVTYLSSISAGTASINYNSGPWTVGGYYQISSAPIAANHAGNDRLSDAEIGASYRFTTRVRLYGAWFPYGLTHDRQGSDPVTGTNSVIVVGLRVAL